MHSAVLGSISLTVPFPETPGCQKNKTKNLNLTLASLTKPRVWDSTADLTVMGLSGKANDKILGEGNPEKGWEEAAGLLPH